MNTNPPKLRRHEKYSYYYYPVNQSKLDQYYAEQYTDPLEKPDDPIELQWKQETLWADILEFARQNGSGVLDIGSGNGELADFLRSMGVFVATVDKNGKADYLSVDDVEWISRPELADAHHIGVCTILNALEHMADPCAFLRHLRYLGSVRGFSAPKLVIRVPNDFNSLQLALEIKHGRYWLHYPEHINYFSVQSLTSLLEDNGWKVTKAQCDWPMELFLTSGGVYDYLQSEHSGSAVHDFRRKMEMNLPSDVRQEMWVKFAEMGIGRNIIVYAESK